jgi:ribosomal protein S18 acetylase RimI-like enzyme
MLVDTIFVEDAPDIPRLVFRHFHGAEDFPKMIAVVESSKVTDGAEWVMNVEELAHDYEHLENCDPTTDMVMAEVDGELVGHGRCWWWQQQDNTRIYPLFAHVKPAWRNRGIRRAILRQLERRLRQIAADHPAAQPRYFQVWGSDTQTHLSQLLESEGYEIVRYGLDMVRPNLDNIPDCPIPGGIVIRPGSLKEWRSIWEAAREAFRDHWGYIEWPEEMYAEWMGRRTFSPSLWRIAWAGNEVAGGVLNYIDTLENEEYGRARGYTETIFVRRPWRKQGLAQAMIAHSFLALKEAGMTEAALSLDAENLSGALHLYRKMGFREVKQFMTYRKPLERST